MVTDLSAAADTTNEKDGRESDPSPPRPRYRVLLPLDRDGQRPGLVRFALAVAHAHHGEVLALNVVTPDDDEQSLDWELPAVEEGGLLDAPLERFTVRAATVPEGIIRFARDKECDLIVMTMSDQTGSFRRQLGRILDPVVADAPCDVALLRGEVGFEDLPVDGRILLATAGGVHAQAALKVAAPLARLSHWPLTLVTAVPDGATEGRIEQAQKVLDGMVKRADLPEDEVPEEVTRRVIRANDTDAALIAAAKGYALVFIGSSNESVFNQLVVGTRTQRLTSGMEAPVVIVHAYRGAGRALLDRFWRRLDRMIPNPTPEEQIDTYKRVRRGARATTDFYFLMLCSVIIATMGLLLNSGAVIIGAMLVAPLMTPILAIGLGVVMGDTRLIRIATGSTARGILLAILLSLGLTLLARVPGLLAEALFTTEIAGRTQPNLFDLLVALAAGAAGAYSISRRGVGAALPGVAIAAALVPPLATIGIAIGIQEWSAAIGAALLFTTNLISIILAGAAIYLALGFFPEQERTERQVVLRRGLVLFLLLLFLVMVPLSDRFVANVQETTQELTRTTLQQNLERRLGVALEGTDLTLFDAAWQLPDRPGDGVDVQVVLYATGEIVRKSPTVPIVCTIQEEVEPVFEQELVSVRVLFLSVNGDAPSTDPARCP